MPKGPHLCLWVFFLIVATSTIDGQGRATNPASRADSARYICGFAGGYPSQNIQPAADNPSPIDSLIINTFLTLWNNACGGRLNSISVYPDANDANLSYKYAAAKPAYDDNGNAIRPIFYKQSELSAIVGQLNNYIFYSIILHELSHHMNGDPFTNVTRDSAELGADDYAGYIMALRFHADLDSVLQAFTAVTDEKSVNGYPARSVRLAAVRRGWNKGNNPPTLTLANALVIVKGKRSGFYYHDSDFDFRDLYDAVNSTKIPLPKKTVVTKGHKIVTEASLSPGEFYIDEAHVYFKNARLFCIMGKVVSSNRPEYKQMIVDQYYNYMYIDANNEIFTFEGSHRGRQSVTPTKVGYIEPRATSIK